MLVEVTIMMIIILNHMVSSLPINFSLPDAALFSLPDTVCYNRYGEDVEQPCHTIDLRWGKCIILPRASNGLAKISVDQSKHCAGDAREETWKLYLNSVLITVLSSKWHLAIIRLSSCPRRWPTPPRGLRTSWRAKFYCLVDVDKTLADGTKDADNIINDDDRMAKSNMSSRRY